MAITPEEMEKRLAALGLRESALSNPNLSKQQASGLAFAARTGGSGQGFRNNVSINNALVQRNLNRDLKRAKIDRTLGQAQQARGLGAFNQARANIAPEALGLKRDRLGFEERTAQADFGLRGQELVQGQQELSQDRELGELEILGQIFSSLREGRLGETDLFGDPINNQPSEMENTVLQALVKRLLPEQAGNNNDNGGMGLRPGQDRPSNRVVNNPIFRQARDAMARGAKPQDVLARMGEMKLPVEEQLEILGALGIF